MGGWGGGGYWCYSQPLSESSEHRCVRPLKVLLFVTEHFGLGGCYFQGRLVRWAA